MGMILANQGKTSEAIEAFQKAIEANEKAEIKGEIAGIHYNLGVLLKKVGRTKEAKEQFDRSVELYKEGLPKYANSPEVYSRLGDVMAENGNFREASEAFAKAATLNPVDPAIQMRLVQSLEFQGRLDEAIAASSEAYKIMDQHRRNKDAAQFRRYTEYLKNKMSQIK
jgi:tetratricopeptide (TPR) repeat protein